MRVNNAPEIMITEIMTIIGNDGTGAQMVLTRISRKIPGHLYSKIRERFKYYIQEGMVNNSTPYGK